MTTLPMTSADPNQKMPGWIFVATDLALLGAATVIALWSPHPLPTAAIVAIAACVGLGAMAGLVPFVARYERQKNALLDERQVALEALAATVASSAEQLSIAASGLHQVAELATKNLRLAEHLPHKLQEKMAEFQALLAAGADAEKEELERELLALRTTESDRLESVSQRIAKMSVEWAKLEAVTHEHLSATQAGLGQLAAGTATAAAASANPSAGAFDAALAQARIDTVQALHEAGVKAAHTIEGVRSAALADFEAKLTVASAALVDRVAQGLRAKLQAEPSGLARGAPAEGMSEGTFPPVTSEAKPLATARPEAPPELPATPVDSTLHAVRRARKVRREDSASPRAEDAPAESGGVLDHSSIAPPQATKAAGDSSEEPRPVPTARIVEIIPVTPDTTEPFSGHVSSVANGSVSWPSPPARGEGAAAPPTNPAERKRSTRRAAPEDEPGLGLDLEEAASRPTEPPPAPVPTSDGATRLIATAYIGIGNRLFIRGEGPGLSWEKGVPLQFVSIGKWRWETNEANAPVHFKLYKNDEVECPGVGVRIVGLGEQHEVTAAF